MRGRIFVVVGFSQDPDRFAGLERGADVGDDLIAVVQAGDDFDVGPIRKACDYRGFAQLSVCDSKDE